MCREKETYVIIQLQATKCWELLLQIHAMRVAASLVTKSKITLFLFCYIISYGTVFWRNSPDSRKLFYIKRNVTRIMAGSKRRVSCRELFRKCDILTLASGFLCWVDICQQHRKISDKLRYTWHTHTHTHTQYNIDMLSIGLMSTEEDFAVWCQLTGHRSTIHETSELQHRHIPSSISAVFHLTHV
jgi:hypothetical protein